MTRAKLPNRDEWLAAEYALGVLSREQHSIATGRYENEPEFRAAVDGWNNQLEHMLDDVENAVPPPSVWKAVQDEIGITKEPAYTEAPVAGLWKWLAGASSALAAASVAGLLYVTGGDVSGNNIVQTRAMLETSQQKVASLSSELENAQAKAASAAGELDAVKQQIASVIAEREASVQEVAVLEEKLQQAEQQVFATSQQLVNIQQEVNSAVPLVASLTQDGQLPAFVAQYDPLKRSLLIRTSASDDDEKVPEVWFIPEVGAKKGKALSLGVMNEETPERIVIEDEFVPWMGEGGTLAITMEPAGGSPTGEATGPIIALGKLQALQ